MEENLYEYKQALKENLMQKRKPIIDKDYEGNNNKVFAMGNYGRL